jgi:hypothetical protein
MSPRAVAQGQAAWTDENMNQADRQIGYRPPPRKCGADQQAATRLNLPNVERQAILVALASRTIRHPRAVHFNFSQTQIINEFNYNPNFLN